jgi:hypothetical protein
MNRISTAAQGTRLFVATVLVLATLPALAFIPSSHTILTRLARNNGKGIYAIEQEVQFRTEADPIVLRERWIVENGDVMRLYVSGLKGSLESWRFDAFYRDGKKQWSDGSQMRSGPTSLEFIEPVLHFRSIGNLLGYLTRAKLVPMGLGQPRHFNKKTNPYTSEPGVRLARTGGIVAWAFGEPSPQEGPLAAGLWIEQDEFTVRRLRFPTQAEVQLDRHSVFAGGLHLARERTVTWDNNSVLIRVLTVKSLPENAATQALLAPAATTADGHAMTSKLPDATQVREFYSRFR